MNNNPPLAPNRRDFIKSLLALSSLSALDVEKVIANPLTAITPVLKASKGMTIEDIVIGFYGTPGDFCWRVSFFRQLKGEDWPLPLLQFPLNQRATFRWVAAPDLAIRLAPGERFVPRFEVFEDEEFAAPMPGRKLPAEPVVTMLGHDIANGKMIINQSFYA